jgi:hypothetical protein
MSRSTSAWTKSGSPSSRLRSRKARRSDSVM